jgi:hypothetical protein
MKCSMQMKKISLHRPHAAPPVLVLATAAAVAYVFLFVPVMTTRTEAGATMEVCDAGDPLEARAVDAPTLFTSYCGSLPNTTMAYYLFHVGPLRRFFWAPLVLALTVSWIFFYGQMRGVLYLIKAPHGGAGNLKLVERLCVCAGMLLFLILINWFFGFPGYPHLP